jgi:hypothetical protein
MIVYENMCIMPYVESSFSSLNNNWKNMYKHLYTRNSGVIKPLPRASCSSPVAFRISWSINYNLGLYMIENLLKIGEAFSEKIDFPFRPLESVLTFPWRYHVCSFILGSDLHKQLKSNRNRYSRFRGNRNFVFGAHILVAKAFIFTEHRNMIY